MTEPNPTDALRSSAPRGASRIVSAGGGLLVVFVLLGLMFIATGGTRVVLFWAASILGIVWSVVVWPEMLVMAYFLAGRYAFDARLAPGDMPVSLNQVMFAAVLGLVLVHGRHALAVSRSWSVLGLFGFSMMITAGMTWTPGLDYGTAKVLRTYFVIVPSVLAILAIVHRRRSLLPFLLASFTVGFGLNAVALMRYPNSMSETGRLTALGSGPNVFARTVGVSLLVAALVTFTLWRRRDRTRREALLGIGAMLCAVSLLPGFVLAQSRGPALAMVLAIGFFAAVSFADDRRRLGFVAGTTILALLLAEFTISNFAPGSRFDLSRGGNMGSIDIRREMISATWNLIMDSPLLGVGTGGWPVAMYGIDDRRYPHLFLLEIASEQGILVALAVAILFVFVFVRGLLAYRIAPPGTERAVLLGMLCLFGYFVVNIHVSGDIVDNRLIWLLLGAAELAAIFALAPPAARAPPAQPPFGPGSAPAVPQPS